LSGKDARIATARRAKPFPTIEQIKHVIVSMPTDTVLQRRDRCLVAMVLATGARDGAIASLKLKHVDLVAGSVFQDAREVKTKFSKTFTTYFFPVGDEVLSIIRDWVGYLRNEKLWGNDDPLFPKTEVKQGVNQTFESVGIKKEHWRTTTPIREIFRKAFESAGMDYFNPHSFRKTLVELGEKVCQSPEEFKAWSQNLGHEGVLTTFYSYGEVQDRRQAEIIQQLGSPREKSDLGVDADAIVEALFRKMNGQSVV